VFMPAFLRASEEEKRPNFEDMVVVVEVWELCYSSCLPNRTLGEPSIGIQIQNANQKPNEN
jgi:hypothetical protein